MLPRLLPLAAVLTLLSCSSAPAPRNQVVGTWQMVSAHIDRNGVLEPAYGDRPTGMLSFTPDMRFVEVLTDSTVPRFASAARGEGTDAENRAAMAGSIGMFGTYTVDADGQFSGNRVEGATFPNWVGDVRTTDELRMVVNGDLMTENFTRPDGTKIAIVFQRTTG
ncbi:MAG: lipocalin-like domain-containing protein [Actinomycetota bacterium]